MRRVATCLALMIGAIIAMATPASAIQPVRFQPGPAPDLTLEGVCDFPVLLHDAINTVTITDFYDQEGNLVREQLNGRILEEVSRLDALGNPVETITQNISGPGFVTFDEDGTTFTGRGPSVVFFLPGELPGFPDGLIWFTTGQSGWTIPAGSRWWSSRSTRTCVTYSLRQHAEPTRNELGHRHRRRLTDRSVVT